VGGLEVAMREVGGQLEGPGDISGRFTVSGWEGWDSGGGVRRGGEGRTGDMWDRQ
jgi:hypothetical protein